MIGKNRRIKFLAFFLAIFLVFVSLLGIIYLRNRTPDNLPNVLLISLDACRADHLSCYGYSRLTSPFIDTLAEKGIRFENAFVNTHGTPSSHTTIFSSLYQESHSLGLFKPGNEMFFFKIPDNFPMLQEILREKGYVTLGVVGGEWFENIGLSRGFMESEISDRVSAVESVAEKMGRLIKKYSNQGKPIFAFFHTFEIHSPYIPPDDYKTIFGDYTSNFIPKSNNLKKIVSESSKLSKVDLEFIKAMYDCEIRYTDDVLKNFFEELRQLNFFKNYIAVITSDHGEEFGDHGGLLHRGLLYDELLHVPLIIVGNSVKKGVVDKSLVSSIDIMPTILANSGIKVDIPMEGRNLLSPASISKQNQMVFSQFSNLLYSVRTHEWKLIETMFTDKLELYNLKSDPRELVNLASKYPDLVDMYKNKLASWRSSRIKLEELNSQSVQYSKEALERLRSLGYID